MTLSTRPELCLLPTSELVPRGSTNGYGYQSTTTSQTNVYPNHTTGYASHNNAPFTRTRGASSDSTRSANTTIGATMWTTAFTHPCCVTVQRNAGVANRSRRYRFRRPRLGMTRHLGAR